MNDHEKQMLDSMLLPKSAIDAEPERVTATSLELPNELAPMSSGVRAEMAIYATKRWPNKTWVQIADILYPTPDTPQESE